jgi:hypothetical protein
MNCSREAFPLIFCETPLRINVYTHAQVYEYTDMGRTSRITVAFQSREKEGGVGFPTVEGDVCVRLLVFFLLFLCMFVCVFVCLCVCVCACACVRVCSCV